MTTNHTDGLDAAGVAKTLVDRLDDAIDSLGNFPDHRDLSHSGRLTERAGLFLDGVGALLRDARSALVDAPAGETEVCASEGCGKPAVVHFIRGDVGSYYCDACHNLIHAAETKRIAALASHTPSVAALQAEIERLRRDAHYLEANAQDSADRAKQLGDVISSYLEIIHTKQDRIDALEAPLVPPDTEGEAQPFMYAVIDKKTGKPVFDEYCVAPEADQLNDYWPEDEVVPVYLHPPVTSPRPAVSEATHDLLTKLWFVAGKLDPAPREDIASIIVALRAALASVPGKG